MAGIYSSAHTRTFCYSPQIPARSIRSSSRVLILTGYKISRFPFSHKSSNHAGVNEKNMTTNNKPAFEIFVVREGRNKKSYFTKIGAAWPTKSGSGYNADLIALPVDGKFILLTPKDKEDASE
jgi:hypothetical protein